MGPASVFQRAQPWPYGQGGTSCLRGVLLCECQEQLCDAELRRLSLLMIHRDFVLFSFLALRSLCACPCTAVQPLMLGPLKPAPHVIFSQSFRATLRLGVQAMF